MLNIESSNVTIMVSNMDKAILFYTETLGLKLGNRYGDHWADIEGPGISIGLHPASKDLKKGDNLSIGFKVTDIDKSVSELSKKGVIFKLQDDDQVRLASFTDPDGNAMYLVQTSDWLIS